MDIYTLTGFFMWCTVLNGAILVVWAALCTLAPEFVYRTQKRTFPLPRETYNSVMYLLMGLFKIFWIFFNAIPYIVLLIVR